MAENIVDFILRKEGFSADPYWDNAQWSIGYGSYAGSRDINNKPNMQVTREQAAELFAKQIPEYRERVDKYNSRYNWTPNERDALTSFAYNIGSIDELTANGTRTKAQIAQKMLEYNKETKGGAKVFNQGLFDRRKEEQEIFLGGKSLETIDPNTLGSVDPVGTGSVDDPANQEAAQAGGEPGSSSGGGCTSNYSENVLNRFDSHTYQWTIYMVHPLKAHEDPASLTESNNTVIISQTGVDDEVSIQTVIQDLYLSFAQENRNAVANRFAVTFLEPGGFTLFNRILFAAQQLGIENHLDACYIFKLELTGWQDGRTSTVGPYFYTTKAVGITFDFRDGASTYHGDFFETKEDAFNRLELHIKSDMKVEGVSTFGEFLDEFAKEYNKQLDEQLSRNVGQIEHDRYIFNTNEEWGSWGFDQIDTAALQQSRRISVTGSGSLSFSFRQGTAINAAIAVALFQTKDFKRVLTDKGQFIKPDPDEGEADPAKLAELTKWVKINTDVKYFMYDAVAKRYCKEITYTADSIISKQAVHDPVSFIKLHQSNQNQRDRLRNIFDRGLLKKRYDYTFTGLNTEVLNLDVKLDTAYYAIQALNSGALKGTTDLFTGSSFDGQDRTSREKNESTKLQNLRDSLIKERDTLKKELETGFKSSKDNDNDPGAAARFNRSRTARLDDIATELKELAPRITSADLAYQAALEAQRKGYSGRSVDLPTAANRYITQSDLLGGANRTLRESLPHTFDYAPVNSLANGGPEQKNDDIGSSMLGAMELNLNALSDLMKQQMFIRGDPYWLGEQGNGASFETGGVSYFLNLNFPTYPNENTGLIESLSSKEENGQFTITGVYQVLQVQARYDGGEFIMLLNAFRDTNTNSNLLYEDLMRGCVAGSASRQPGVTGQDRQNETDNEGSSQDGANGGDKQDSDITPRKGNDNSGNHKLATDLDPALFDLLTKTANETGVTVQTTSGVRKTGNTKSGRHTHGNASDTALFMNGRQLSVSNPADRAVIAQFSQNFYNNARAQGYNPSIGWADHTAPVSKWYMQGNVGHFDIASGRNRRPDGDGIGAGFWGNDEVSDGAPSWLRNIYR